MTDTAAPPSVRPAAVPQPAARSRRPVVVAGIMAATFMIATESTIVATAMPHIVGELGGFAFYTWVFSAYLLAQCTMTLIFGKLSDVFGRAPVMIAGLLIFLAGSLAAGFAGSMGWLIAFRLVQGVGAGAIQPMTITLIGDLYTPAERPRVQGLTASVWAGAAVFGPLAGGLIVAHLSWAWIFWINLPVGVLTIAGFALFLHEDLPRRAVRIDYAGAALFTVAIVCLLFLLTATGLPAAAIAALAAACVVAGALFVLQELRAPEPMISVALWRRKLVAASNAASFLAGMALVGVTTVLPLYVQGVMGRAPVTAGLALTALIVGWTLAMTAAGRCFRLIGVRRTLRLGSVTMPLGAAVLLLLSPQSSPVLAGVGSAGLGAGMGLISVTSIVLVQESVERTMRGSATASILFSRSFGNAVGATVIGALLTLGIAHTGTAGQAAALHRVLDEPAGLADLVGDGALRAVFDAALHWSFRGVLAISALAVAAVWTMPVPRKA